MPVFIHQAVLKFNSQILIKLFIHLQKPLLTIRVRCSKGTYIRSLAHEIGEGVGSGAYLRSLRRTRSGGFTAENGWQLEDFMKKLAECETK